MTVKSKLDKPTIRSEKKPKKIQVAGVAGLERRVRAAFPIGAPGRIGARLRMEKLRNQHKSGLITEGERFRGLNRLLSK